MSPGRNDMIEWPAKPFYIQSRIGGGDWVLAVDRYTAVLRHRKAGIEHLWKAIPDPRGGSFLTHIESGLVLVAPRRNPEPSHGSWDEVLLRFFIPVSMALLTRMTPTNFGCEIPGRISVALVVRSYARARIGWISSTLNTAIPASALGRTDGPAAIQMRRGCW